MQLGLYGCESMVRLHNQENTDTDQIRGVERWDYLYIAPFAITPWQKHPRQTIFQRPISVSREPDPWKPKGKPRQSVRDSEYQARDGE